jgi:hypothetical protein
MTILRSWRFEIPPGDVSLHILPAQTNTRAPVVEGWTAPRTKLQPRTRASQTTAAGAGHWLVR